ncbi:Gpi1-domain-containing protein [Ascodesmis nigricans]|uniref:Gpi1-domain-containing protein n=1 Tax=Ascodesmis nigricans TaxID=341454 RepID=A0A4S2N4T2_9PEZI|nr:Gpi1-domain-containing protein [Ascodesmis nigricans]
MRPLLLAIIIFIAGYFTARYSLITQVIDLSISAWERGVVGRATKAFLILSIFFFLFCIPIERIVARDPSVVSRKYISTRTTATTRKLLMGPPPSDDLMRIFWPLDISRSSALSAPSSSTTISIMANPQPGVLVGWRNSAMDIFVVAVLTGLNSARIENELRSRTLFRKTTHNLDRMFQLCGRNQLHVLGELNGNPPPDDRLFSPDYIHAFTYKTSRLPRIWCPPGSGITLQVILFNRPYPRQMEYLMLNPICLVLEDKPKDDEDEILEDQDEREERIKQKELIEKLKLHSVAKRALTEKEQSLQRIIDQINCSYETRDLIVENAALLASRRQRRALSVSERVVESAQSAWKSFLRMCVETAKFLWPFITTAFVCIMLFWRCLADILLQLLEWRLRPEYAAFKDISATAQQIDIRLQQFCYWPLQYVTLRRRKGDWDSVTTSHPDYIRFYNSLWLVANDIIIGIALGSYIIENAAAVAYGIDYYLRVYTVEGIKHMIHWLMDQPLGLKLNNDLAKFLGDLFLWVVDYWAGTMTSLRPHLPYIIYAIGISSFAGASMPIALFSDLLSLLTLHILSFYIASARIYNWQLTIILSLFHLFRGKKRNVLRNRIDACDYGLDQLLVGSVLFTLLIFLLPTVLVFYILFATARTAIISLKASLETCLAFLNHFPLFALMLRVKDPQRLPGGIRFELHDTTEVSCAFGNEPDAPASYILLKSTPLTVTQIFDQYFQLALRIRKHYISPHVILCLVTGRFVPPLHRRNLYSMQYSMLPTRRASMWEVWSKVQGEERRD